MAQAAPKIAGLVAFSAVAIAFFTRALGLVTAREEGVLRRWHGALLAWPPSAAGMTGHDLPVLAGWEVGGLLVSFRFFAWDPHRPAHAGKAGARTTARSA
jgi:hypothetical protein